jgi:guanylate kinase
MKTILIIAGASGVGKGSVDRVLTSTNTYKVCTSCTTRKKRPEEVHGEHYFFVSFEEFEERVVAGEFLEHKVVHGNRYGTLTSEVERTHKAGFVPILEIDVQGALELIDRSDLDIKLCSIFLKAPSNAVLEKRLRGRGTESEASIQERLAAAELETVAADQSGEFKTVVNGDRLLATANEIDEYYKLCYPQVKK